ncbi:MAG: hypothetical protein P8X42_01835 [Calditrichaceae bacterium]
MQIRKYAIYLLPGILLCAYTYSSAQDDYQKWLEKEKKSYNRFLEKEDKAFSDFLKKEWKAYQSYQGIQSDEKPKPVAIPVARPEDKPAPQEPENITPIHPIKVPPPPKPKPKPKPVANKTTNLIMLEFYGAPVSANYKRDIEFHLSNPINNEMISAAWETMAGSSYKILLEQIQQNQKELALNDWGYIELVNLFATKLFPSSQNEQNLFSWFMLCKTGFEAKVAYKNNTIYLLVPAENLIYANRFITLNDKKYYFISFGQPVDLTGQIYTYAGQYKDADRQISMRINQVPILENQIENKNLDFKYNGESYIVPVQYDKDMINFLSHYPQTELVLYFDAAVSNHAKISLLKSLKPYLEGKSEVEAVNFLLRFVQTAFKYEKDDEQFGKEKYLMPEETLFYPASDCEDRSILFSYLVRNLLDLDIIGLDYPGHISTAVNFHSKLNGAAVNVDDREFIICDPTYINAVAGMVMPQFKNVDPKVIRF